MRASGAGANAHADALRTRQLDCGHRRGRVQDQTSVKAVRQARLNGAVK